MLNENCDSGPDGDTSAYTYTTLLALLLWRLWDGQKVSILVYFKQLPLNCFHFFIFHHRRNGQKVLMFFTVCVCVCASSGYGYLKSGARVTEQNHVRLVLRWRTISLKTDLGQKTGQRVGIFEKLHEAFGQSFWLLLLCAFIPVWASIYIYMYIWVCIHMHKHTDTDMDTEIGNLLFNLSIYFQLRGISLKRIFRQLESQ